MIRKGRLFTSMDKYFKYKIKLGYDNALTFEGMVSVEVNTKESNKKVNNIYYTPNLKHNLLSI